MDVNKEFFLQHSTPASEAKSVSKNSQDIWWTRNASRNVTDLARDEEAPSFLSLAMLSQFFQIEHFTDWHSPPGKEDLMELPGLLHCYEYVSDRLGQELYVCQNCGKSQMGMRNRLGAEGHTPTFKGWMVTSHS